ncbi:MULTISPECIES: TetR family transcriptional regulator [unclassified Leptolyngbya]|uniref:TetR family transcriptional regulator n=1 Tax=unclassified Leptolyngbya TaxID=2650499 RepID=UPI001682863D|nr:MULTISPECIES: TetR family transcriptional regulator [unclassified Leptolyngbya]MBD1909669.1 TetR family transcriptional regulator [Leptolyngbya sp. FACHB-8]MBD2157554.1 TetR family transcriptional regulator [Leptolyngbya sp. FACHB-16]
MPPHRRTPTRQRLIQAATQLFIAQGIAETTTRQIADAAEVNEVTLFRHFGSKHGLLLAMMEDPQVLAQLGMALGQQTRQISNIPQAIKSYANVHLQALAQLQEFVRSLIGESGHYSIENRRALGQGVAQANRYTAQYLTNVLTREGLAIRMPPEKLASLLNSLLLGYAVLEFSSEFHEVWQDRENFVDGLVQLFLYGALVPADPLYELSLTLESGPTTLSASSRYIDLPTSLVHQVLARAMEQGGQDYALAYVLLGAGLSAAEVAGLERSHVYSDERHYWLQISREPGRQVPLNQWICGQRYGSHPDNPLSQWLRSRTDGSPALFLDEDGHAATAETITSQWHQWVTGLMTPLGYLPQIEQCWATWCVDMLMRGLSLEDLRVLTGKELSVLEPFVQRVQQRRAVHTAAHLDQQYPV